MPNAVRPWQHVLEPLYGYLLLAQAGYQSGAEFGCGWNFGPRQDQILTVRDVLNMFYDRWPGNSTWTTHADTSGKSEAAAIMLNSEQAQEQLGWHPTLGMDLQMDITVDWYTNFYGNSSIEILSDLTMGQIEQFLHCVTER